MKPVILVHSMAICLLASFSTPAVASELMPGPPKYDEAALGKRYQAFLLELDYVKVAADCPKVIKELLSDDSARQVKAVRVLGETGDPAVIPWLVLLLDSQDEQIRIWSGCSIQNVIEAWALKRRDVTKPDRVVLRPLAAGEMDLRPFAWVALKMFRKPDDGNTHAYAATVTRYLELQEFEYELRLCLLSRHPAVSNRARWALQELGFTIPDRQR